MPKVSQKKQESITKSIFGFLKDNYFLFSVISMVLCGLAYLYQVLELRKWDIPLGMVDDMRFHYLLIIVLSIIYCFSATYLQEYINLKFDDNIPSFIVNKFIQRSLSQVNKVLSTDDKYKEVDGRAEETRQLCRKQKLHIIKTVLLAAAIGSLCFAPFFMLFFSIVLDADPLTILILYGVYTLIMIASTYWLSSWPAKKAVRKIRKDMRRKEKSANTYLGACESVIKLGLESTRRRRLKYGKTNRRSFKERIVAPITAIATFLIIMVLHLLSPPPNDYWIYTDGSNSDYVVVFESNDNLILKRADIKDDNISIFLDDQLHIRTAEKALKHTTFKKVIIENSAK